MIDTAHELSPPQTTPCGELPPRPCTTTGRQLTTSQTSLDTPHVVARAAQPTPRAATMSLVTQFLGQIREHVRSQRGDLLRSWLQVEPNSAKTYYDMAAELRAKFNGSKSIEDAIEAHLPIDDDVPDGQGTVWPSFQSFVKDYLTLWRDINYDDLLGTHELLTSLVK